MNFDKIMTQGQIASALLIIAFVLIYYVFAKKTNRHKGPSSK